MTATQSPACSSCCFPPYRLLPVTYPYPSQSSQLPSFSSFSSLVSPASVASRLLLFCSPALLSSLTTSQTSQVPYMTVAGPQHNRFRSPLCLQQVQKEVRYLRRQNAYLADFRLRSPSSSFTCNTHCQDLQRSQILYYLSLGAPSQCFRVSRISLGLRRTHRASCDTDVWKLLFR